MLSSLAVTDDLLRTNTDLKKTEAAEAYEGAAKKPASRAIKPRVRLAGSTSGGGGG